MENGQAGFYFRATNSIDRICIGDLVFIVPGCTLDANSIVLTTPDLKLKRINGHVDGVIGRVEKALIKY